MMVENKAHQQQLNCFQKLETLNEKLKQLAQIMETMRDGMRVGRNRDLAQK